LGSLLYTLYIFPRRRSLNQLLARLESKRVSFRTYPDNINDGKGWIKRKWRGRTIRKEVYCVIIFNAEPSLAYELRQFGRVRFEAQALTPTLAAGMLYAPSPSPARPRAT
jgi:hypothetical protein